MVPSESWTSSWSRSRSPRMNWPSFFLRKNLQTLLRAHREKVASADFAKFRQGNMAAGRRIGRIRVGIENQEGKSEGGMLGGGGDEP